MHWSVCVKTWSRGRVKNLRSESELMVANRLTRFKALLFSPTPPRQWQNMFFFCNTILLVVRRGCNECNKTSTLHCIWHPFETLRRHIAVCSAPLSFYLFGAPYIYFCCSKSTIATSTFYVLWLTPIQTIIIQCTQTVDLYCFGAGKVLISSVLTNINQYRYINNNY